MKLFEIIVVSQTYVLAVIKLHNPHAGAFLDIYLVYLKYASVSTHRQHVHTGSMYTQVACMYTQVTLLTSAAQ